MRTAALRALAAEELEPLIERAVEARAAYLEAVGGLGWLLRNGALPAGDVRAQQLVLGADTAPSRWPEAVTADARMPERLAELGAGPHLVLRHTGFDWLSVPGDPARADRSDRADRDTARSRFVLEDPFIGICQGR